MKKETGSKSKKHLRFFLRKDNTGMEMYFPVEISVPDMGLYLDNFKFRRGGK